MKKLVGDDFENLCDKLAFRLIIPSLCAMGAVSMLLDLLGP